MNDIEKYNESIFENIKHIDEEGNEYWSARELMPILEYRKWERFSNIIENAKIACVKSGYAVEEHFPEVGKMVTLGSKARRKINDYFLSRYACYLITQNGDPRKKVIALAQTYFAIQTRLQELTKQDYKDLEETEKRLKRRSITKRANFTLNQTARKTGVKNFDKFHNAGYKGLYNGETADDIAKRKALRYREDILDNMSSEELAANIFRISQTEAKLKRDNIKGEKESCDTHYEVGSAIRKTIESLGGTMPENLPTPKKSLKEISKDKELNKLKE